MSSDLAYMRVNLLVIVYQNFIANVKHFPLTFIMVFAIISLGKTNGSTQCVEDIALTLDTGKDEFLMSDRILRLTPPSRQELPPELRKYDPGAGSLAYRIGAARINKAEAERKASRRRSELEEEI